MLNAVAMKNFLEQIEDIMSMLSEMGITVVENDDAESDGEEGEEAGAKAANDDNATATGSQVKTTGTGEHWGDPLRMYLRKWVGGISLAKARLPVASA